MKEEPRRKTRSERTKREEPAKRQTDRPGSGFKYQYVIAAAVAIAALAVIAYFVLGSASNVSFSSFKQNFESAQRVAVVVHYHNSSTYGLENTCTTYLVEVLASHRNPSTIDFFTIDNNTCTYIPGGIGHPGNVSTTDAATCLKTASSEPSISLSYGSYNRTETTPYGITIYGDSAYMRACPIAVDMS